MNKYNSFYLGIVVQNDDPEMRGRVKIYVPHISATVYENWNKDKKNKKFKFMGTDNPDLNNISDALKEILPWAECASPLFGGSASGRYNEYNRQGTTSDANDFEDEKLIDGSRGVQNYIASNKVSDAFTSTGANGNRFSNQHAYEYTPSNYSNLARGLFSIPNVGSHIWVFFTNGNPNSPVYFAASYGQEDWKRIYTNSQDKEEDGSVDYPGSYENKPKKQSVVQVDSDSNTFRSKTAFNSNKHTIELVDTDNREILKMTHFSGSFKEFNNYSNIELATGNDQLMVMGDQFMTVYKNQGLYVAQSQENIVKGDRFKKVGSGDKDTVQNIVNILKEIHEYKLLFDLQRADPSLAPKAVSKYQLQVPPYVPAPGIGPTGVGPAPCPVCLGIPYVPDFSKAQAGNPFSPLIDVNGFATALAGIKGIVFGSICDTCMGTGVSPSTQDGNWNIDVLKKTVLPAKVTEKATELANLERLLGDGDEIIDITKSKIETIGLVMNDMLSYRVDPVGKLRIRGIAVAPTKTYVTYSPSPHVEYVDVDDVPGGDYLLTCTNKYKLLVGAKGINIKTHGPIDMYGTIVNIIGEQLNISARNEVVVDGGERFSIRARIISFHPFEHAPVVIDGQLHVARNAVVGGGMMVEGELGVTHITAPYEFRLTERYYGNEAPIVTGPAPAIDGHSHVVPPHTHWYRLPACTLLPSQDAVRGFMITKGINRLDKAVSASPVSPTGNGGVDGGLSKEQLQTYVLTPSLNAANNYPDKHPDTPVGYSEGLPNGIYRTNISGEDENQTIEFKQKYNIRLLIDGKAYLQTLVTETIVTKNGSVVETKYPIKTYISVPNPEIIEYTP